MALEWMHPKNWSEETKNAAALAVKAAAILLICLMKDNQSRSQVADFVTNRLPKVLN